MKLNLQGIATDKDASCETLEVEVDLSELAFVLEEAAEEQSRTNNDARAERLMEAAAAIQRACYDCQLCGMRGGH